MARCGPERAALQHGLTCARDRDPLPSQYTALSDGEGRDAGHYFDVVAAGKASREPGVLRAASVPCPSFAQASPYVVGVLPSQCTHLTSWLALGEEGAQQQKQEQGLAVAVRIERQDTCKQRWPGVAGSQTWHLQSIFHAGPAPTVHEGLIDDALMVQSITCLTAPRDGDKLR